MPSHSLRAAPDLVVRQNPVHATIAPFPGVCFTLTLLTDVAYWRTANLMWSNFSSWLLLAGLVTGALALIAGTVAALVRRRRRRGEWRHGLLGLVVLAIAFVNSLVHAADGWTTVVPWLLVLSTATVLLIILTALQGRFVQREAARDA
jgi:uncharacterized membrane protein